MSLFSFKAFNFDKRMLDCWETIYHSQANISFPLHELCTCHFHASSGRTSAGFYCPDNSGSCFTVTKGTLKHVRSNISRRSGFFENNVGVCKPFYFDLSVSLGLTLLKIFFNRTKWWVSEGPHKNTKSTLKEKEGNMAQYSAEVCVLL